MSDKRIYKNLDFESKGVIDMLNHQSTAPYYGNEEVDELLKAYPDQTTRKMAASMFMLGFINGKRAERARRKAVQNVSQNKSVV